MIRFNFIFLLAINCLTSLIGEAQKPQQFTSASPDDAGFSAARLQRLDTYLQKMVDDKLAPNIVTFVAREGKVVHFKSFGYKNVEKKEAVRKDDIFRLASQTKAITSVALMMLFEEGKFLLEDPISQYIPAFKNPKVLVSYDQKTQVINTRPAKREITIKDLLSHTAGISYENPVPGHPKFSHLPFLPTGENLKLSQTVPLLAERPLIAEPGEKFVYGPNTDVLAYLVEILSGKSLSEFFQERIFEPLGMTDTYFYLPEDKAGRLVELYSLENLGDRLSIHKDNGYRNFPLSKNKTYFLGGAGLVGPIEDYAKFCQMIVNGGTFNGKQLLSRSTIDMMSRNQIGDLRVWNRNDKFGLGFQVITDESHYADQATPGSLMWGGMFSTEYTIDPKENLILLIYTNVDPYAYEQEIERKFRILVYQALR